MPTSVNMLVRCVHWPSNEEKNTHRLGLVVFKLEDGERAVALQRTIQVPQITIDLGNDSIIGQSFTAR